MDGRSSSPRIALLAVPVIVVVAAMATARPPAARPSFRDDVTPAKYYGPNTCKGCHGKADNPDYTRSKGHIKLSEHTIWTEDKHGSAHQNLKGVLGAQMGQRLGLDVADRKTGCLGCHSGGSDEATERMPEGDAFDPAAGVSCENCHGPAQRWFGDHFQNAWRQKSAEEKAKLSMTDLRDPSRQTAKCLSCHVGNVKEGKVVTHEMYAVGHPPLPSIEVARFADNMRHWWLIKEKPETKSKPELLKGNEFERTRLALVGAANALKAAMMQIAEESAIVTPPVPGESWPDYARFDCASCHHELQRPSWRQERGFALKPGRPPVGRWPIESVRLGIDKLAQDDPAAAGLLEELKAHESALNSATGASPFGRMPALKDVASRYAAWADGLAAKLAGAKYDEKSVRALLAKLLATATEADLDYDAARHVVWTAWTLYRDLLPYDADDAATVKTDGEVKALFAPLSSGLNLDLPIGRNQKIADGLKDALIKMGDYEPAQFRSDVKALAKKLVP